MFKLFDEHVTWYQAKSRCEDRVERLAVLDSLGKQDQIQVQGL